MLIKFLLSNLIIIGLITMLLMLSDYFLTLLQEKERKDHYSKHYQSYPINTIEGNPAFQESVSKLQIINPRHLIATVIIGVGVPISLIFIPADFKEIFLGFIWGIYLIVCYQHLSNLIGYRISRKGIHGILYMHQRTGYMIQSGRYTSIIIFLFILSILSGSQIIYGVTIAGVSSSFRLFTVGKKINPIEKNDFPTESIEVK